MSDTHEEPEQKMIMQGGIPDPLVCRRQAAALRAGANHSEIAQIAWPLRAMAVEWERAAQEFTDLLANDETALVVLAGSLSRGMYVSLGYKRNRLVRIIQNGGQMTLHVEPVDDFPKPEYVNLQGATSPVVVFA